ncbi:MAG: ABC transporter ATP-binding protein [Candidatus Obscuribacterales bacterium]|nr:ABC transporter ATP-binding protein [Candidatus Obscuribacterales bacterium]
MSLESPAGDNSASSVPLSTPGRGIIVEQLTKTYKKGKVKALNGLSLHIDEGETFGLIGPNGAGKTTFFGCLLAFLQADSGTITIDGMPPDALDVRKIVGYLPERLNFDRWMTGFDFLSLHHELALQPSQSRKTDCEELLTLVNLDKLAWKLPIKRYSRGMLQRLGFAQALIGKPKYLLLDEPASGVDPAGVILVRNLLKNLKDKGVTIVLNSHQLDQVEKSCDRVAFIKAGQVDTLENLRTPKVDVSEFILRWQPTGETQETEALQQIIMAAGAQLIEIVDNSAIISLPQDAIASTIKALILNGFPIIHAAENENRLERFFKPAKEKDS